MVIDKCVQTNLVSHYSEQSLDGMGNLEVVVVVVTGKKTFVELVVGDGVEHAGICPAGIIPVNDLTHQPEFRFYAVAHTAQIAHEAKVEDICCIEADTVNVELADPEPDCVKEVVLDVPVPHIELDEKVMPTPVIVGEAVIVFVVSPEIDITIPVPIARAFAILLEILEGKAAAPCVIENAVDNDLQADV